MSSPPEGASEQAGTAAGAPEDSGTGDAATGESGTGEQRAGTGRRRPSPARAAVLFVVFVCAACGLVYELALVALGSYLIGDTVGQASIVLAVMVFAMGMGALAAKPLQRNAAAAFVGVEIALALLGGLSVLVLYAAFAWLSLYTPALVVMALMLGLLIGAEIPLLMVLLQRIRTQDAGSAVADMFAADYVGGLVGGLAFPFLLLPLFGQLQGALVTGIVNAAAGLGLVFTVFRRELAKRVRMLLLVVTLLVVGTLGGAYAWSDEFEVTARQALYTDPVVHAEQTRYQNITVTRSESITGNVTDTRLYLNGDLQFSSVDEYRYHEALVHPAMVGKHRNVLILGGGDGLALREVLRYPDVRQVTLVDLDPAVTRLARTDPVIAELNDHAFDDPRVRVRHADAFAWLRDKQRRFDTVIVDMPDPDSTATAKLYSAEFYALVRNVMAPHARVNVQAGSPYFAPKAFWSIASTMREAGLPSEPYRVNVPSFGEWGFHLSQARGGVPDLRLPSDAPRLRSLDNRTLRAASTFPPDRPRRTDMPVSTLMHPVVMEYSMREWTNY